jgi:hypothetical protein
MNFHRFTGQLYFSLSGKGPDKSVLDLRDQDTFLVENILEHLLPSTSGGIDAQPSLAGKLEFLGQLQSIVFDLLAAFGQGVLPAPA